MEDDDRPSERDTLPPDPHKALADDIAATVIACMDERLDQICERLKTVEAVLRFLIQKDRGEIVHQVAAFIKGTGAE